ncbi:nicalin [Crotalus adamanteus]|uniref:BOS complex subunit NCLN n=1 Tax=Crotalus adamanteus TaxID=8729 RepID=A0AAW1C3U3_CROAD
MLEEAGEEVLGSVLLKASCLPLSFLLVLPAVLLLLLGPPPASAAHEFTVYRMQQYELGGQPYGTRNAVLNTEARTVEADVLSRRCVMMRLVDFSYEQYQKALRQSAGAVVIILPHNMASVPQDVIRQFMEIEPEMLAMETIVPVYFAKEDDELLSIYEQTQTASTSQGSASAAEVLLHTATANGFQMVTSGAQSKAVNDWLITSIEGRLTGLGGEDLPTIVLVAHYDSFGVAPWLSHGADSNGSGVAVLLELARLFSRLYTYKRTHAAYNLLFFASGGGKFNYQGTKRWLEDNLDHTDFSLLQDNVAFVLCLDTLGRGSSLHLHVSKPPKEGTLQHTFLKELEQVVAHHFPEVRFSMVHKKINLAEDMLAWEHERFAIRRLPAFTVSHLESHREGLRNSIMDVRKEGRKGRKGRKEKIREEGKGGKEGRRKGKEGRRKGKGGKERKEGENKEGRKGKEGRKEEGRGREGRKRRKGRKEKIREEGKGGKEGRRKGKEGRERREGRKGKERKEGENKEGGKEGRREGRKEGKGGKEGRRKGKEGREGKEGGKEKKEGK